MVTHNDAIKDMADRVVKLRDGMIRRNYQKAGHKPDGQYHQQENHQIFSKFPLQFPGDTFT